MNQIDLVDKVAVITGGAGGIGFATADRMLRSGAKVVLWDLQQGPLDNATRALPGTSSQALDITDEAAVGRATADVVSTHGRIDILVNGAGITSPKTLIVDFPLELWRKIVEVNLTGTFLCCKAIVPHMQKANAAASSTSRRLPARRATRSVRPIRPRRRASSPSPSRSPRSWPRPGSG